MDTADPEEPPDELQGLLRLSRALSFNLDQGPGVEPEGKGGHAPGHLTHSWREALHACAKLQWSWDLLAISIVYFIEGFSDLAGTAVSYYVKDELGLSPAEAGLAASIALIPWNLTTLMGLVTDAVPIAGFRRKAYLGVVGCVAACSWLALPHVGLGLVPVILLVFIGNACSAWSQVVADAVTVKLSQGQDMAVAALLQSLSWVTYTAGAVLGGLVAGSVIEALGPVPVFRILGACSALVAVCGLLITEQAAAPRTQETQHDAYHTPAWLAISSSDVPGSPTRQSDMVRQVEKGPGKLGAALRRLAEQLRLVWATLRKPHIGGCALFVFAWQAVPAPTTAMFYFQTNVLGLQPRFMELMWLLGSLAGFVGVLVYNLWLVRRDLRGVLLAAAVAGTALNAAQLLLVSRLNVALGISDELLSMGDYSLLSVLAEVMLTPMMALAARSCPDGIEGTLPATLYSLLNLSRAVSAAGGAGLTAVFGVTETDFTHLLALTALCNALLMAPLPLLALVPPGCGVSEHDGGAAATPHAVPRRAKPLSAAPFAFMALPHSEDDAELGDGAVPHAAGLRKHGPDVGSPGSPTHPVHHLGGRLLAGRPGALAGAGPENEDLASGSVIPAAPGDC